MYERTKIASDYTCVHGYFIILRILHYQSCILQKDKVFNLFFFTLAFLFFGRSFMRRICIAQLNRRYSAKLYACIGCVVTTCFYGYLRRYGQNISDTNSLRAASACGSFSYRHDLCTAEPEVLPPRRERNFRRSISRLSSASLYPPYCAPPPLPSALGFVFFQTFRTGIDHEFLTAVFVSMDGSMSNFYERS